MPTSRSGHVCALVKKTKFNPPVQYKYDAEIVVVGGYKSEVVEIFNVRTFSWRTGGKLQISRTNGLFVPLLE
jgi:hypothetical protein